MLAPPAATETPRIVAEINTLEGLRLALRDRAEALDISRGALDAISGVQEGYSSKLLAPRPIKKLGDTSLPLMLTALGLRLVLIEDDEAAARVRSRFEPRQSSAVRVSACLWGRSGKQREVSRRWIKRIAREGGLARAQSLTAAQRRKQARRAALIRWRDVKAAMAELLNAKQNGGPAGGLGAGLGRQGSMKPDRRGTLRNNMAYK